MSGPEPVPGRPGDLEVTLARPLPEGVYTVNWRSVSTVDGHVQSGAFAFGVGRHADAGQREDGRAADTSPLADGLGVAGRWLLYAGLALLVGAASTCLFVFGGGCRAAARRLSRWALVTAAVGLALMTWSGATWWERRRCCRCSRRPRASGCSTWAWPSPCAWRRWWPSTSTPVARRFWAAGRCARWPPCSCTCWQGTRTRPPRWRALNVLAQWVHMSAIGVWVGGLAWLLLGIRGAERPARAAAVSAFSRVATITLVVVLVTGVAARSRGGGLACRPGRHRATGSRCWSRSGSSSCSSRWGR